MNEQQQALWARLQAFELDDPASALFFSKRLARDNGWSIPFARRVFGEYKRFLFLAMEAGHPVTPSDEVDQAWHLHMVYTRSYWDDLCARVLGRPLHHGPTRGGTAEGRKFEDWYARTLESYRRLFDEPPPTDIWPNSRRRFGLAPFFRRVNTAENWVIRKPRAQNVVRALTGTAAMGVLLGGCALALAQGTNHATPVVVLLGILAVFAVIAVGVIFARRSARSGSGDGGGCGGVFGGWFGGGSGTGGGTSGHGHHGGHHSHSGDAGHSGGDAGGHGGDAGSSGCGGASGCGGGGGCGSS